MHQNLETSNDRFIGQMPEHKLLCSEDNITLWLANGYLNTMITDPHVSTDDLETLHVIFIGQIPEHI